MPSPTAKKSDNAASYDEKGEHYFAGARDDYVEVLPVSAGASILEVGCGAGNTGALALRRGRCARYCGVELFPAAAALAKEKLTEVVLGDIEQIDLPWPPGSFDALIMSEVLEHFADPWAVLRRLRPLMKPGGIVLASSPNVSHASVVWGLLRGEFSHTDEGLMDRTHLRWFTPQSYRQLFEESGFVVDKVFALNRQDRLARFVDFVSRGRLSHLFWYQTNVHGHRD